MIYQVNQKYLAKLDSDRTFLGQALLATALTISRFCMYYSFGPKSHFFFETFPSYAFPSSESDKENIIKSDFLSNISATNGEVPGIFAFFMDKRPIKEIRKEKKVAVFDHHDTTDAWVLNLSDEEFETLKKSFANETLPVDLFIPTIL